MTTSKPIIEPSDAIPAPARDVNAVAGAAQSDGSATDAAAIASAGAARRSLFAASHLAASSIILNVISFPVTVFIVRELDEKAYGMWSTAMVLMSTLLVITNLGLRGTFVRSVARDPEAAPASLADQLGARLMLSFVSGAALLILCAALYDTTVVECGAVMIASIIFQTFGTTLSDLLQGMHRMSVYALANFIAGLALTAASVVVIWLGFGPVALSAAYLVGPVLQTLILAAYVRRNICPVHITFNFRRLGRLLKDSRFFAAQQFVGAISANAESLILPKLAGQALFGLFSGGLLLASRLTMIPDSLASAFYPVVSQAHAQDPRQSSRQVVRFLLLMMVVCLPVAVATTTLSGPIARVLFPKDAELCRLVISVTIWALPLVGIEQLMGYALYAAGKDAWQAGVSFVAAVVNLAMATVLVWFYGIPGACLSYLLRPIVKVAISAYPFARTYSPQLPLMRLVRVLACAAAMALSMELAHSMMPDLNFEAAKAASIAAWTWLLGGLLFEGLLGIAVYAVALFCMRILRAEDLFQLLGRRQGAV